MAVQITMPDLGVSRAVLSVWFVPIGSAVEEGERLVEILAGPATIDVVAPVGGRLIDRCVWPDDPVLPGQALGHIEEVVVPS